MMNGQNPQASSNREAIGDRTERSARAIQDWLVEHIAELLEIPADEVDVSEPFSSYGLSSRDAVGLSGDLESWLGRRLSATLVFEYPTIEVLAEHLADPEPQARLTQVAPTIPTACSTQSVEWAGAVVKDDTAGTDEQRAEDGPIAIIGMACRFPGAPNLDAYWQLLRDGVDAIREVPPDRWDAAAYYDPDPNAPGLMNTRWGGFLEQVDRFDPYFFGISPREAVRMDPQQRLLLEVAWAALEDAGQPVERLMGSRTGVFIGITGNDYGRLQLGDPSLSDAYAGTGNAMSIAANRLSYVFGWHGPSMAVDTACSSSLVAVHLACQSLWSGQSHLALVGGVNLILLPSITVNFTKAGFMAPDGRCKAFDASANGYVRSEGAGVVLLKPLEQALADGDPIHAVIRGSAVNQDGRTNGLTAPSSLAQENVLREAYRRAGVVPGQIQYVEAHGTGTMLGDPIEAGALGAVLNKDRPKGSRCAIGSVKTNIGHLEAAAGIAGLIKVALSLRHGEIPPSLHFTQPNPHIRFDDLPLRVQTRLESWPEHVGPALAGVSSFGFGGTNAHVVLAEAPQRSHTTGEQAEPERTYLLPISARSPEALTALARSYQEYLLPGGAGAGEPLAAIASSAGVRRSHHGYRLALLGQSHAQIIERLSAYVAGEQAAGTAIGQRRPGGEQEVVFVFSGQGSQWRGMARELLARETVFREVLTECDRLFQPHTGWSLLEELAAEGEASRLDETEVAQPAIFAIQAGLAALWRSWGVVPAAVVGHSIGEVTAAHVAGALSLPDAVRVVYHRSKLMQQATGMGQMVAVELEEGAARRAIGAHADRLAVAAINGPASTVLAGEPEALAAVVGALQEQKVACRPLGVKYAFHSPQMAPFQPQLAEALAGLQPVVSQVPIISTVTGKLQEGEGFDAAYWGRNIREPVRFSDALGTLIDEGQRVFLELSPHPVLGRSIVECLEGHDAEGVALATLRRGRQEQAALLESLGRLYCLGCAIDWAGLHKSGGDHVRLPEYPFQRQRYWLAVDQNRMTTPPGATNEPASGANHPLLGSRLRSPALQGAVYQAHLGTRAPGFLGDHRVYGAAVLPAAAYVEMALSAAGEGYALENIVLHKALTLTESKLRTVQTVLAPAGESGRTFHVYSLDENAADEQDSWSLHASGQIRPAAAAASNPVNPDDLRAADAVELPAGEYYQSMHARGLQYGPAFQRLARVWRRDGAAAGFIAESEAAGCRLHPALLDACFQLCGAALPERLVSGGGAAYLPVGIARVQVYGAWRGAGWAWASLRDGEDEQGDAVNADVRLYGEDGQAVAEVMGLRLLRVAAEAIAGARPATPEGELYGLAWRGQTLPPDSRQDPGQTPKRWLILADAEGVGERLADSLGQKGERATLAAAAVEYGRDDGGRYLVDPRQEKDLLRLLVEAAGDAAPLAGVVYLWGLAPDGPEAANVKPDVERACQALLHLVQALAAAKTTIDRLWVVTRGASTLDGGLKSPEALAQAPLWGLVRTIALEHPELRVSCLDLDPASDPADSVRELHAELQAETRENQVSWRSGQRYVARLAALVPEVTRTTEAPAHRLIIREQGTLDNLELTPMSRRSPGAGQVEIRVRATGLNFRDVLNALGLYPGDAGLLGGECAGKVAAVGPGVTGLRVGDDVMAIAPGSFASFVTTDARLAARMPADCDYAAAATIPITFLTAYYALHHLGGMRRGDRVLIHTASGGVGQAAVQLARLAGAEIFATAGTPDKRTYLAGLGIRHVMNSRTPGFGDEVLASTGGLGVDLVLNSLTGDGIAQNFRSLAQGGRYLEIGKIGIWDAERVRQVRPDIAYHVIDLAQVAEREPDVVQTMLGTLAEQFEAGALQPLPKRTYPLEDAASAFRYMAQARHIGKVVVAQDAPEEQRESRGFAASEEATYLITGGLGALGLEVARWLVGKGARHLVLTSRSGVANGRADQVRELEEMGARVSLVAADVACREETLDLLARIEQTMPPLRGIVHAAGIRGDGVLLQQTWPRFAETLAPKVAGAWYLHELTQGRPLDFFVMFSSVAALIGSPGQASYAAANAFLDGLAHYRRARGMPAASINWGPWDAAGMAAELKTADRARWAAFGMAALPPERALALLEQILQRGSAQAGAWQVDWQQFLSQFPAGSEPPFVAELLAAAGRPVVPASPAQKPDLALRLAEVAPNQRHRILMGYLSDQVTRVLALDAGFRLDVRRPLNELGMDSLMAVELRNKLAAATGVSLPATLLFDYPTIEGVAGYLLQQIAGTDSQVAASGAAKPVETSSSPDQAQLEELEALSEAQMMALIDEEFKKLAE